MEFVMAKPKLLFRKFDNTIEVNRYKWLYEKVRK